METTRQLAIAEHLQKLQAGLRDLEVREKQTREDLDWIVSEIARYKQLIADTRKQAADETAYLSSVPPRTLLDVRQTKMGAGKTVAFKKRIGTQRSSTRDMSKTDEIRFTALSVLSEFGRPLKRYDLTQRLLERGLMEKSSNPVDLVRKALHHNFEISFDQNKGYFLPSWPRGSDTE